MAIWIELGATHVQELVKNFITVLNTELVDNLEALFRNVPPPLSLALAMTEKHEKAERAAIMKELNCSELEAAHIVAKRLAAQRDV